eukprot:11170651-Lingulodinium_polyedra.AAC.1
MDPAPCRARLPGCHGPRPRSQPWLVPSRATSACRRRGHGLRALFLVAADVCLPGPPGSRGRRPPLQLWQ